MNIQRFRALPTPSRDIHKLLDEIFDSKSRCDFCYQSVQADMNQISLALQSKENEYQEMKMMESYEKSEQIQYVEMKTKAIEESIAQIVQYQSDFSMQIKEIDNRISSINQNILSLSKNQDSNRPKQVMDWIPRPVFIPVEHPPQMKECDPSSIYQNETSTKLAKNSAPRSGPSSHGNSIKPLLQTSELGSKTKQSGPALFSNQKSVLPTSSSIPSSS